MGRAKGKNGVKEVRKKEKKLMKGIGLKGKRGRREKKVNKGSWFEGTCERKKC